MANEIVLTGSLTVFKPSIMTTALARSVTALTFNMSGNNYIEAVVSIATTATAIPLGPVTAPHWGFFRNLDATNFLTIRNGASGADLLKLLPGEAVFVALIDSAVPNGVANTAACLLEYLIFAL